MTIDSTLPTPIYQQLKALLIDEIALGRYSTHERLPTEHELCKLYGISRTPVTRALAELAEEGVLRRQRGIGTFVDEQWLRRRAGDAELRVVAQEGPWAQLVRETCPASLPVSIATVPRPELHRLLQRDVGNGEAPDLAIFDSILVPEFAAAGYLVALEELDDAWVRLEYEADFLPPLVAANRFERRTYGATVYATVSGLWYRRDALESRGLAPPATWAQLRAVARAIADDGLPHPIVMTGGLRGEETTAFSLLGCLASNGAEALRPDGVSIDSRETVQTLRFLRGLIEAQLMSPDVVGYAWDEPSRLLADGRAAMSFGGSYEAQTLADRLGVRPDALPDHLGFVPIPAGPGGAPASVAGGMSAAIFRQSSNPRTAMRLLESIVAPEALARPGRAAGRVPSRRSAITLATPHLPSLAQTAAMFETAVNQPSTPSYPRVSVQLQTMLEAVLTGRLGPTVAAQKAGEAIRAITG